MIQKTVAIIHYNTPELTMAAISSLLKNGGGPFRVVVFDNSDQRPFEGATNVQVFDNTKGQIIDFDKELEKYPERDRSIGCTKGCEFGSVKHMMTVQKLWELLPQGFVLMESDILIKKNIDEFFREEYSVYGYCQKAQPHNPFNIGRMLPMLCWMNVPMLTREGAKYFDPTRTYGLLPGGRQNRNNWYDTGAVLLEDILTKRPRLKGYHRDIREFVEHYGSGSWKGNDLSQQMAWLEVHKNLLPTEDDNVRLPLRTKVAICAIGRLENRYAVEWVEHYNALGVDKIFVYDNNRVEDGELFQDVLQPYIEAGFVEITYFEGLQRDAYEKCYRDHSCEYEWIGFFDFDELVDFANVRMTIPVWIDQYNADVVCLNWQVMTDNGLTHYDPRPMKERFTEGTGEDFGINHHVKSFVRGGLQGVTFCDPHIPTTPELVCVNVLAERIEQKAVQPKVIHSVARLLHFNTKTAEEWVEKVSRGWTRVTGLSYKQRKEHAIEYFFSINERTPEKEEILGVKKPAKTAKSSAKSSGKPKTAKRANSKKE